MNAGFSLRRRLLWQLVLPLSALLTASGFGSYRVALYFADQVYDGWLYDSAHSLAQQVQFGERGATLDLPTSAEHIFTWDDADTTYYSVVGDGQTVIAQSAPLPKPPLGARSYREAAHYEARVRGERVRVSSLELPVPHATSSVRVTVAETTHKRDQLARSILLAVLLPQALLVLTAGALIWSGIGRGLRPLAEIAERIKAQSEWQLQPIPDAGAPMEVWPLTHALNDLLARLDSIFAAQRKFISDAAHQLRTPLTAIKLNVERALAENSSAGSAAGRATALHQLRHSSERAAHLSNQLLLLARAEPSAGKPTFARLNLVAAVREIGSEWVPRALDAGIELSFAAQDDSIETQADVGLLREAVGNLLDNALKYAGRNARIVLSVRRDPLRVAVADNGAGIAPEMRKFVFERFNRGDRKGGDGVGLGLAIVKEIALAHNGSVSIEDGLDGRGICVGLTLPEV